MGGFLVNDGPKWLFLILYIVVDIFIFIWYFLKYYQGPTFYYMRQMVGVALPIARASAASLNFNCMLILLPVCRNVISLLRGSCTCCVYRRSVRRQLDRSLSFHKVVAIFVAIHTTTHVVAHCFNFEKFIEAHDSPNNETRGLLSALSNLPIFANGTILNPIRSANAHPVIALVSGITGITGVVCTLVICIMVSSATPIVRHYNYEVFWYTHHLVIPFFIALVLHGLGAVVKGLTNGDVHNPYECETRYKEWGRIKECPEPHFEDGGAQTWKWVVGPMVLYLIERMLRVFRSCRKVTINKIVKHKSDVIELELTKAGFSMEAGEYVFLKVPSVSHLEWHPFTLTSAPEEGNTFSVHIRIMGDWTKAVARKYGYYDNNKLMVYEPPATEKLPRICVDGPFGTASEDIFKYDVAVLVGAGIGVTPFASVLKHIWYLYQQKDPKLKTKKIYFHWIARDSSSFEWFADVLKELETTMRQSHTDRNFIEFNTHLTKWDSKTIQREVQAEVINSIYCDITSLREKTQFGRPKWDTLFKNMKESHPRRRIGVFLCGPKPLAKELKKMCLLHSDSSPTATQFIFNKENF